jgi:hypothetical protein
MKRKHVFLLAVAMIAWPALAESRSTVQKVTLEQLKQALAADHEKPDAEVAQQLLNMELTERLSAPELARMQGELSGGKAREALQALADLSVFLSPPAQEVPEDAPPDAAAAREMLTHLVNYVNTTLRQLPNLIASRETTGYEDRPAEDIQQANAMVSLSYLPLHVVGKSSVTVTYRDHKEVIDEQAAKGKKSGPRVQGLQTGGVFGPILSVVASDALKGKITWGRWEKGAGGTEAVFHYEVPKEKSEYKVQFCCVPTGVDATVGYEAVMEPFSELAAYHGEIAFDPASGAILRMTLETEMPPHEVVSKAGLLVEYGAVEIGGKSYICPTRSVSVLMAHTTEPSRGAQSAASFNGQAKTFLNDVEFGQYRRFGSETRILTGEPGDSKLQSGPAAADAPLAPTSRTPTH